MRASVWLAAWRPAHSVRVRPPAWREASWQQCWLSRRESAQQAQALLPAQAKALRSPPARFRPTVHQSSRSRAKQCPRPAPGRWRQRTRSFSWGTRCASTGTSARLPGPTGNHGTAELFNLGAGSSCGRAHGLWCCGRLLHRHLGVKNVGAVNAPTIRRSKHANGHNDRSRHCEVGFSGAQSSSKRRSLFCPQLLRCRLE